MVKKSTRKGAFPYLDTMAVTQGFQKALKVPILRYFWAIFA